MCIKTSPNIASLYKIKNYDNPNKDRLRVRNYRISVQSTFLHMVAQIYPRLSKIEKIPPTMEAMELIVTLTKFNSSILCSTSHKIANCYHFAAIGYRIYFFHSV